MLSPQLTLKIVVVDGVVCSFYWNKANHKHSDLL